MAMPSKGSRTTIISRVPDDVFELLEERRRAAGVQSVSQYVADVLASYTGRSDLVRELDQTAVPRRSRLR